MDTKRKIPLAQNDLPDPDSSSSLLSPRPLLCMAILALTTFVIFGRTISYDWLHWDDNVLIFRNPTYLPVTWKSTGEIWTTSIEGMYNPLTRTLWGVEAWIGMGRDSTGQILLDPRIFHLGSVLLHLANGLVVFWILRQLTGSDIPSLFGALLFVLHPLQVEAVCWISETKGVLCGFFCLLVVGLYLRFAALRTRDSAARIAFVYYGAALLSFLLALLAKSAAVSLPLVLVILDRFWNRRSWRDVSIAVGPWFLFSAAGAIAQKVLQPDESLLFTIEPLWRPLVMVDGWWFYSQKLLVPLGLTPFYDHSASSVIGSGRAWLGGVTLLLLLFGLSRHCYARMWMIGIGIAIAFTLPYSGLLPHSIQRLSTVNDRYMYLAMLGPAFCLAWFLSKRGGRNDYVLCSLLLLLMAGISFVQTEHWRNDRTFFTYAVEENPKSATALKGLAFVEERDGNFAAAEEHLRQAVKIDPQWSDLQFNLGVALHRQGKREEAIAAYREALRLGPHLVQARQNLAVAFVESSKLPEAIAELRAILVADPHSTWAIENLGNTLLQVGEFQAAEQHYRESLQKFPRWSAGYANLGVTLAEQNKLDAAAQAFRAALELDPQNVGARQNLSRIEQMKQKSK